MTENLSHLEPLRFVIEESTATLEQVLGDGLLSPKIALILAETATISSAVTRLATALDKNTPEVLNKPPQRLEAAFFDLPQLEAEMAALRLFSEALRAGDVCDDCGGIRH